MFLLNFTANEQLKEYVLNEANFVWHFRMYNSICIVCNNGVCIVIAMREDTFSKDSFCFKTQDRIPGKSV